MFKSCVLAFAFLLSSAHCLVAAGDEGVSGGQFLRIGVGAKESALGEAGAVVSGAQSLFYNPAGINDTAGTEVTASYASWVMDTGYSSLALAKKGAGGAYGLGVNYFSVPSIDEYDKYGSKLSGSYSVMDMAVTAGYGRELVPGMNWGVNVKYISSRLDTNTASAVAADAGLKYEAIPGSLTLGFAAQNVGTRMRFNREGDPLPLNLKIGGQYMLKFSEDSSLRKDVSFFTDVNELRDSGVYASFGVDMSVHYSNGNSFSVRGGYKTDVGDRNAGAALGLGVNTPAYTIDYAYSFMGDLGQVHRISLGLRFDGEAAKKDI